MSSLLIKLIRLYQINISPRKISCCRFTPTCSSYAIKAIEVYGCLVGSALAIFRIFRCNPLCKGGYDPVPEKKSRKHNFKK